MNRDLLIGFIEQQASHTLKKLSPFALVSANSDILFLAKNKATNLWNQPLYDGDEPLTILELLINLEKDPWFNNYWSDWLSGLLKGVPLDWNLQRAVALIPDADWDKGPAHIAGVIEHIKAQFLKQRLPLSEKTVFNTDDQLFEVIPVTPQKPDLLSTTLEKVSDALEDALFCPNGLQETSRETRVLRRTIERYANNPERVEMDFVDVHTALSRQMESGEIAHNEENIALTDIIRNGALDIRANHPDIAENREIRAKQALNELSQADKDILEEGLPLVRAISKDVMSDDFASDIPALINDAIGHPENNAPPLGAATRTFSRAAEISLWLKTKEVIKAFEGSAEWKLVKIVGTISSFIAIGLRVLGIF